MPIEAHKVITRRPVTDIMTLVVEPTPVDITVGESEAYRNRVDWQTVLPVGNFLRDAFAPETVAMLLSFLLRTPDVVESLEKVEIRQIYLALDYTSGNRRRAAQLLGIARSTFLAKLRYHGMDEWAKERYKKKDR